jgi:hypothetical protein
MVRPLTSLTSLEPDAASVVAAAAVVASAVAVVAAAELPQPARDAAIAAVRIVARYFLFIITFLLFIMNWYVSGFPSP